MWLLEECLIMGICALLHLTIKNQYCDPSVKHVKKSCIQKFTGRTNSSFECSIPYPIYFTSQITAVVFYMIYSSWHPFIFVYLYIIQTLYSPFSLHNPTLISFTLLLSFLSLYFPCVLPIYLFLATLPLFSFALLWCPPHLTSPHLSFLFSFLFVLLVFLCISSTLLHLFVNSLRHNCFQQASQSVTLLPVMWWHCVGLLTEACVWLLGGREAWPSAHEPACSL